MKTSTQFYGCKSPEISRSAIGETVTGFTIETVKSSISRYVRLPVW
jgi:hypothetical protein